MLQENGEGGSRKRLWGGCFALRFPPLGSEEPRVLAALTSSNQGTMQLLWKKWLQGNCRTCSATV